MVNIKPGLTPTVITDRNGKITTVHKSMKTASSAGTRLPAPALSSTPRSLQRALDVFKRRSASVKNKDMPSDEEITELHNLMAAGGRGGELSSNKQVFLGRIASDGRNSVIALTEAYKKEGFKQVFNQSHENYSSGQMIGIAALYEPNLFTPEVLPEGMDKTSARVRGYVTLFHAIRTSEYFESVDTNNIIDESPESLDKLRSYAQLHSMCRELLPRMSDLNYELIRYAFSDETNMDQVTSVIKENRTLDLPTIRGIIEGAPKAVAEGWL